MEQIKSGLDALKAAVEQKLTVEDYNQIDGGYELLMSDGSKIYIYHGAAVLTVEGNSLKAAHQMMAALIVSGYVRRSILLLR